MRVQFFFSSFFFLKHRKSGREYYRSAWNHHNFSKRHDSDHDYVNVWILNSHSKQNVRSAARCAILITIFYFVWAENKREDTGAPGRIHAGTRNHFLGGPNIGLQHRTPLLEFYFCALWGYGYVFLWVLRPEREVGTSCCAATVLV